MGSLFTATVAVICTYQIVLLAKITIFLFRFWQYRTTVTASNFFSHCHGLLMCLPVVLMVHVDPDFQFQCLAAIFYRERRRPVLLCGDYAFPAYGNHFLVAGLVFGFRCHILNHGLFPCLCNRLFTASFTEVFARILSVLPDIAAFFFWLATFTVIFFAAACAGVGLLLP